MIESSISRVLILYTGGTIGMKSSPRGYIPAPGYLGQVLRELPQFHDPHIANPTGLEFLMPPSRIQTRVAFDLREYTPLRDSSNLNMRDWGVIAQDIFDNYERYDAFVVLHGTDTMAFTASALSFMLQNLAKTVVITGSQIPLAELRNDAVDNLLGALLLAGNFEVPEVCLYFHHKLQRGNRTSKVDADGFDAFHSGNLGPLIDVGINVHVHWNRILTPPRSAHFRVQNRMDPNVGILRLFPGITPHFIRNFTQPPLKGLVLHTYGSGNAPDTDLEFLAALKEATDRGVVIVNCTQCFKGAVVANYATGQALAEVGVVNGRDMTVESALAKLSYLFAQDLSTSEIKRKMQRNMRGELTEASPSLQLSFKDHDLIRAVAQTVRSETRFLPPALIPMMMCAFAASGDLQQLRRMVEHGADVRAVDYDKRTALHLAAAEGHVHSVDFLLEQGAAVNALDRWGRTPLHEAVRFGQDETAALLREQGGQLFIPQLALQLCAAAMHGDLHTLRRLISNGADVHAVDYDQRSALHLAAAEGHVHVLDFLLDKGSSINSRDRWKQTPLLEAVRHAQDEAAELLFSRGGRIPTSFLERELRQATVEGSLPRLQRLLRYGGKLHAPDEEERILIHLATAHGHFRLVSWMAKEGVDLHAEARGGRTPLWLALEAEYLDIADFLFERGCRLTSRMSELRLLEAIQRGQSSLLKRLLRYGANPNAHDESQRTALHYAITCGHEHQASLLLRAGANPHLTDEQGVSPLQEAVRLGRLAIADELLERGATLHKKETSSLLFQAVLHNQRSTLQRWIRFGASLESRDAEERTFLHIAALHGHRVLVEWLLEQGLLPEETDRWGRTALEYARQFGQHEVTKVLEGLEV